MSIRNLLSLLKLTSLPTICFLSMPAAAKKLALLVAVSNYPNLGADVQLDGPLNDVQLVREYLSSQQGFGADSIIELSESKTANKEPTKANILAALNELNKSAKAGDFVFMHFGGHGSRQPASEEDLDELDGYDEIFLPKDAANWDDYIGAVTNAITDNEIHQQVDSLLAKGVDTWVVFDSCHSGTMTRGHGDPEVRMRKVDERLLGVPNAPAKKVKTRGNQSTEPEGFIEASAGSKSRGKLIAFSAAQTTQTTPERRLPRHGENAEYHGLFTYSLIDSLSGNQGITYRQLGQLVMTNYRALPWYASEPLISGENLDDAVFGLSTSEAQRPYEAKLEDDEKRLTINAGTLHGMDSGAQVSFYSKPTMKKAERIYFASIASASTLSSTVNIDDKTKIDEWPASLYVKLDVPAVKYTVNVAALITPQQNRKAVKQMTKAVKDSTQNSPLLEMSKPANADWLVAEFEQAIWFLRPDQSLPCEYQNELKTKAERDNCNQQRPKQQILNLSFKQCSSGIKDCPSHLIETGLNTLARATTLVAMQSSLRSGSQDLSIDFQVSRNGKALDMTPGANTKFKAGDEAMFKIQNTSGETKDVSILFKDGQYGITQIYPEPGQSNRLEDGQSVKPVLEWTFTSDTTGNEDIIVIAVPAGDAITTDFKFLEQAAIGVRSRGQQAKPSKHLMAQLLADAANGEQTVKTRGIARKNTTTNDEELGSMSIFSWSIE